MILLLLRRFVRFGLARSLVAGLALALVACALSPSVRADLVWTPDGGWQVEGGVLGPLFGDMGASKSALEAMNKAKAAQEAGRYWSALSQYNQVIADFPGSVFAPEALFQESMVYIERHQFEKAYDTLDRIIKRYPDYPNFNGIIRQQFRVGDLMSTERPYLMGWFPWFKDPMQAADFYEGVAKNAPATEYAPMALMKIALLDLRMSSFLDSGENAAKAIDALKRLINDYPQSMLASNAYLELADVYSKLVIGPPYDQGSTRQSIRYLEDYLYYYKDSPDAPSAEKKRNDLLDTYARSQVILGDFYYYYRNSNRAALIFYNQAVTLAPTSAAATQARAQIDKIRHRIPAPMTPYDMLFGRYNDHALSANQEQGQIGPLAAQAFASPTSQDFAETPGPEVVETIAVSTETQPYESFAPFLSSPGVPPPPSTANPSTPSAIPVQGAPEPSTLPPDRPLIR